MNTTIVIPVYNEEDSLAACLNAIATQTVRPHEVLVVDNNSTDNTVAIARSFPFVKVLHEPKQGVAYARNTGFNAATGDIIGRIDADTLLPSTWVEQVARIFADPTIDAVSGAITYRDILFTRFFAAVEVFFRQWVADGLQDKGFLYGGNMALRRSRWHQMRTTTCCKKGLHEDIDLGIHAGFSGQRTLFDRSLHATVLLRRFDTNFVDFWQWAWLTPRTYSRHGLGFNWRISTVALLATIFYGPIKLLHRIYDADSQKISLQKLFATTTPRVNPATFID